MISPLTAGIVIVGLAVGVANGAGAPRFGTDQPKVSNVSYSLGTDASIEAVDFSGHGLDSEIQVTMSDDGPIYGCDLITGTSYHCVPVGRTQTAAAATRLIVLPADG